jgi:hypothetical protein
MAAGTLEGREEMPKVGEVAAVVAQVDRAHKRSRCNPLPADLQATMVRSCTSS